MRVVVVGAGLGGLSAAAHLVGAGHDVTVVERGDRPGGRAGVVERDGFRLDNGPTVLTMPGLLADTFAAAGAELADHVELRSVDPMYRAVFADGSVLHVRHGREAMTEEIRAFAGGGAAASFARFADWLAELYRVEMPNFIDADFDSALDLVRRWRAGLRLVRLGGFGKLDRKVASFFDDERLQRIFGFQAMYAGVAPHEALALYSVITYMDTIDGVVVPVGGMHAMATGLADAVTKAGATFCYEAPVTRILRDGAGAVRGVELGGGERLDADVVVCNADLPVAYRTLLDGVDAPRAARRGRFSPSCVLWVAGVRGLPAPDAAHHNIHFGRKWAASFDELIHRGERMSDPSILVTLHSRDDPSLAPTGCSTLYALEPVPNLDGQVDWTRARDAAAQRLRQQVAAAGYPVDVVTEEIYDPLDWEAQGMARGTPFGLAHTFRQTGPFRPANVDRRVPGLVFVGSSTVPGVGVPMVLVSGKLAAARVGRDGAAMTVTLEDSYAECRRLNKRHGTTYYWSTALLPAVKRHHVHALYAFCRYADDLVDDLGPASVFERAAALGDLGDRFFADVEQGSSDDLVLKAVVHTVRAFDIDPDAFRRFLRSMAMDLTVETYATYDDLRDYMDGSAAVIGEMMLPILEPPDLDAARGPARALGEAFQLTNFLRDIDEDLDRGRQYLPQVDLKQFEVDLAERRCTPEFVALMCFEIDRCRGLYDEAATGIAMLPARSARCVAAAHDLYGRILDRIERQGYDVFQRRARVATPVKLAVAARHLRR